MTDPEQNPTGAPDGAPQDPTAGHTPQTPQTPQYGAPASGTPQPPQYGAPPAPQYGAPQAPASPGYGSPEQADPGKTLGIVGLVLSIVGCTSLIGLILSIVALTKSKKAGYKNGIALAGIIVGAVMLVVGIVVGIALAFGAFEVIEKCVELGPGTHYEDGVTYTCS